MSNEILCVGEILWDALPDGLFLGGAPFNVARHLSALDQNVVFVSRVGEDVLGEEALRRLRIHGLTGELVQIDDSLPTGFVRVELEAATGEPDYEIVEPAAWDAIAMTAALRRRASDMSALVYGSLAQRAPTSRKTIQYLCECNCLGVFDVNLRPPHVNEHVIEHSLRVADVVKMNAGELERLGDWFDIPIDDPEEAMRDVATHFDCETVCVTWGGNGARLLQNGTCSHHGGYGIDVEDTVGAGDAFLSALLAGLLDGYRGVSLLNLANRLGAYVASHSGAFPSYEIEGLDDVADLPLGNGSRTDSEQ